jgi:hypothetical protein
MLLNHALFLGVQRNRVRECRMVGARADYRAIGNAMAVNYMRWIGRRIAMVEASQ